MRFRIRALQDISIQIPSKSLTVLIGPNGSGKSTILKILATLARPSSGYAFVFDHNVLQTPELVRGMIGFLPENLSPPSDVTPREYLNLVGHLRKVSVDLSSLIDELLTKVRLLRWRDVPIQTFSRGMQQRLGFAQTMLGDPDLYLLDEPLSALDASGRAMVMDMLQELKGTGKTIIVSTHRDEFFRDIADQMMVLENGRILETTGDGWGNDS